MILFSVDPLSPLRDSVTSDWLISAPGSLPCLTRWLWRTGDSAYRPATRIFNDCFSWLARLTLARSLIKYSKARYSVRRKIFVVVGYCWLRSSATLFFDACSNSTVIVIVRLGSSYWKVSRKRFLSKWYCLKLIIFANLGPQKIWQNYDTHINTSVPLYNRPLNQIIKNVIYKDRQGFKFGEFSLRGVRKNPEPPKPLQGPRVTVFSTSLSPRPDPYFTKPVIQRRLSGVSNLSVPFDEV